MDKKQAVKVISEAVKIYDNIHCNKNLLIIFGNPNKPSYIETKASVRNFFHLTGVKLNNSLLNDIADKYVNILDVFYSKAMQNKLSIENFDFKDSSTIQKLQVLVNTLKISTNVKMFGDYLDIRINLKTDKIAGSVNSFLGFIKDGKYYIPNTVMADDLRKNTIEPKKVLAILSKNVDDDKYNTIKMVGKKIDIKRLLEKVSPLVEIESDIIGSQNKLSYTMNKLYADFLNSEKIDNNVHNNFVTQYGDLPQTLDTAASRGYVSKYIVEQLDNGDITETQQKTLKSLKQAITDFEEPLFEDKVNVIAEWSSETIEKADERCTIHDEQKKNNNVR